MNKVLLFSLVLVIQFGSAQSQIPAGQILGPFEWKSKIYPGTEREYWVYVPKQYDASKPACTMIVQDGLSRAKDWRLPSTLDSLIALKGIPVIIGIFIDHGKVKSSGSDNYPRFNRSFEYDALGDRYARFLLEEIIPEVGKSYNLSNKADDRLIAGASSGAIAAFNAAWERPNEFSRVLSTIGTYVGLRGGGEFATLVRKTEPKPLRVFLQDGDHDLNIYAGDWWMANQDMLSALTWAGYEVNHAWGDGGHNGKHAAAIMPMALKWLWGDYPKPVQTYKSPLRNFDPILENELWKEISIGNLKAEKLTVNDSGQLFFADRQSVYRLNGEKVKLYKKMTGEISGISFGINNELYVSNRSAHSIDVIGKTVRSMVKNVKADFIAVSAKGIYFTETIKDHIGFYSFAKRNLVYTSVPFHPTGLAISADQTFLNVGTENSVFGYSLKIGEDGGPDLLQEYIHYHIPYGKISPGSAGMSVDNQNRIYTATGMGIQISDQLGRINYIIASPLESLTDVKFGGSDFSTVYVVSNGRLFMRKTSVKGVLSQVQPVKPPKPGL
ncbi:MAG: gluconolactonase [Cyclobacteriaceae bacterium]|nr:gluconolactonase [Cyclobacteriaceae bacterium]